MKLTALVFAAATLATALTAVPALAQDIPSLSGTWKGKSDGIGKEFGWLDGPVTLDVTEQHGRSFRAKITYGDPKGDHSEELIGTISPDGKSVYLAGDDGIHLAALNGTFLDSCYLEADEDDAMAVCIRFEKS
ncbi:hypothetical protein GGR25_001375 [Kaistia hirudinis]|uniref:TIGR03067 domain-containing protein n=1 Tax=Kaistia hirudinis TaxID=1293440 RepID=A0A840APK6_9HYPH|nr:hypothetical protein [Kaistia hirudinis]MBB3930336.1 hypothetical protein [Kaistia hirudinis]